MTNTFTNLVDRCEESKDCPFRGLCWQHIPKPSVFNIPRFRKKWEFLYDGTDDPRPDFIQKMLAAIPSSGSIVVYHQAFEISRLKELARDFSEHGQAIEALIPRKGADYNIG